MLVCFRIIFFKFYEGKRALPALHCAIIGDCAKTRLAYFKNFNEFTLPSINDNAAEKNPRRNPNLIPPPKGGGGC